MKARYKISLLIIGLMLVGCLYITQSYALWIVTEEQTNQNEMEVGCFSIGFNEQSESIKLDNTYPVNDSLGLSSDPYTFTISNTCTVNNNYVITLNTLSTNTLDASKIKYALYKSTEEKPTVGSKLSRINSDLENLRVENLGTSYILDTGILSGGTKVDGVVSGGEEVTYNLYLWIDEIAGNEVEGQSFEASINVINSAMEDDKMPAEEYIKRVSTVESGDGLYKVSHDVSEISTAWNQTEYRYAGVNPNNYVRFNNEIWRIIGLVNVKTDNGIEQRVKIIRTDGITGQKNFGNYAWDRPTDYSNNWTMSKLQDMLNDIYSESSYGECYTGDFDSTAIQNECNFKLGTNMPKGINATAQSMIEKNVVWNIGGSNTNQDVKVEMFYERERGTGENNIYPTEWSNNGIGLIYPSDYGYATNGGNIGRTSSFEQVMVNWESSNGGYKSECGGKNWLKPSDGYLWTLTPHIANPEGAFIVFNSGCVVSSHYLYYAGGVYPTIYLKPSVKIATNKNLNTYGTIDNPFVLEN